MALVKVEWGGAFYTSETSGSGVPVEIWSNSLHMTTNQIDPDMPNALTQIQAAVVNYFNDTRAAICSSVQLDYVKANVISEVAPYHQITDPTVEIIYTGNDRGPRASSNPGSLSNAYKVTLDDGTRNRRARGGFFVPQPEVTIQPGGRIYPTNTVDLADAAASFIAALNAIALGGNWQTVVWSPTEGLAHTVTRLRVGDVLDDISRRRNGLKENYQTRVVTP